MARRRRISLRCAHLSQRVLWPCWREAVSDGYCSRHHNDSRGKR